VKVYTGIIFLFLTVFSISASTRQPTVKFQELAVAVNGLRTWKVMGPDLNGHVIDAFVAHLKDHADN
jgi:hypothetical protein